MILVAFSWGCNMMVCNIAQPSLYIYEPKQYASLYVPYHMNSYKNDGWIHTGGVCFLFCFLV